MLDLMVDLMKSTWTLGNPSSGTGPFFAPSVTHLFIKTFSPATLLLTQMNQQLFDDLRNLQRQPKQSNEGRQENCYCLLTFITLVYHQIEIDLVNAIGEKM